MSKLHDGVDLSITKGEYLELPKHARKLCTFKGEWRNSSTSKKKMLCIVIIKVYSVMQLLCCIYILLNLNPSHALPSFRTCNPLVNFLFSFCPITFSILNLSLFSLHPKISFFPHLCFTFKFTRATVLGLFFL